MPKRRDLVYWNIPVTKSLDALVKEAIKHNLHNTKADFVREAVRWRLREMGVKFTLEIEVKEAVADV